MVMALILIIFAMALYHDFRVDGLKTKLSNARSSIQHIRESEESFVERCILQEEILGFYANEENYELRTFEDMGNYSTGDSIINLDNGSKAREVLNTKLIPSPPEGPQPVIGRGR